MPGVGTVSGFAWGVEGLWWGYAFGAVASFLVGVAWFLRGTWREGVVDREAVPASDD